MNEAGQTSRPDARDHDRAFFSFLTLAYRTEHTLGRTIRSVLGQSSPDWELVVVDNGMSDAVAAVVEPHLRDPRIQLVRQENRGPAGGIEAAAEVAGGRYLVVLNSDDEVTSDFCAVMRQVLESDTGIAAVTCDAVLVDERDGRRLPRSYLREAGLRQPPDGRQPLRLAQVIDGPCPFYAAPISREVWDAMGGMTTETPKVSDLDFWLRTIAAGHDVRMLPDRLGVYSVSPGSESRPVDARESEQFEEQWEAALTRAAEQTGRPEDLEALQRARRRLHYRQALRRARHALMDGDTELALEESLRARAAHGTLRARALVVGLHATPSLLARLHPAKQGLQERLSRPLRRRAPAAPTRRT